LKKHEKSNNYKEMKDHYSLSIYERHGDCIKKRGIGMVALRIVAS